MKTFTLIALLTFTSAWAMGPVIQRPFMTDGCTLAPEGTREKPELWRDCCVAHDLTFWGGGTKAERDSADQRFKLCIESKAGARLARIFFSGVRIGRLSPIKLPGHKWGNAWGSNRGFEALTEQEIQEILDELPSIDVSDEIRESYRQDLEERLGHL